MIVLEIALAALLVLVVVLLAVCYRLMVGQGRLLLRIEEVEREGGGYGLLEAMPGWLAEGLPPGSGVKDLELSDPWGTKRVLSDLLGTPLLLAFVDPRSRFSQAFVQRLAALSPPEGAARPVLVSLGNAEDTRAMMEQARLDVPVLIQGESEVNDLYLVPAAPAGYLVSPDGIITSSRADGTRNLLALLLDTPEDVSELDGVSLGEARNGIGPIPAYPAPTMAQVGDRVPDFSAPLLEGGELTPERLRGHETLLVFSDPGCGPCEPLARELREISEQRAVVMIARGKREDVQEYVARHNLQFPVAIQRGWHISRKFGLLATPIAYKTDAGGVILAGPAIGLDETLALSVNRVHNVQESPA